ncbi:MAG: hypothetical protein ACTHME_03865 [Candidatus Nitrosocosmicus sp.]
MASSLGTHKEMKLQEGHVRCNNTIVKYSLREHINIINHMLYS